VSLLRPAGARRRNGGRSEWAQIVTDIGRPAGRAFFVFGLGGMRTTATRAGPIACRLHCGPFQSIGEEEVPFVLRGESLRRRLPAMDAAGEGGALPRPRNAVSSPDAETRLPLHQVTRDLTRTATLLSNDAALHLLRRR